MNDSPTRAHHGGFEAGPRTRRKPLWRHLLGATLVLAVATLLLMDGASIVGRYMPFSVERNMAARYVPDLPKPDAYSDALNAFAEKIAALQGVPPEITVEVHVVRRDPAQAFATLGGHILVYEGILRALRSEDELAALLSHQISHLAHRHPAEALGRRVSVSLMLSLISPDWAEDFSRPSFHASLRTAPRYLEEHEAATLEDTGATLYSLYGDLGGAVDLSNTLRAMMAAPNGGELRIADTHPGLPMLDEALQQLSQERDWPMDERDGKRRALPANLKLTPDTTAPATPAAAEPTAAPETPQPAAPAVPQSTR